MILSGFGFKLEDQLPRDVMSWITFEKTGYDRSGAHPPRHRNWELGVLIVSLPADSAETDCGIDLDVAAPLPYDTEKLSPLFPLHRDHLRDGEF